MDLGGRGRGIRPLGKHLVLWPASTLSSRINPKFSSGDPHLIQADLTSSSRQGHITGTWHISASLRNNRSCHGLGHNVLHLIWG